MGSSRLIVQTGLVGVIFFIGVLGCSIEGAKPDLDLENTVDAKLKSPVTPKSPRIMGNEGKGLSTSSLPKISENSSSTRLGENSVSTGRPPNTPSPSPTSLGIPSQTPSPSPTSPQIPTQTPSDIATPGQNMAIPIPLVESFAGLVSVVTQVGSMIQEFEWGLINNSKESIIVLAARTRDSSGNVVVEIPSNFITDEWSGGRILSGNQVKIVTGFEIGVTIEELLTYQWIWTLQTQTDAIIVCTFNIDTDSCVSNVDSPTINRDRPNVSGALLTINGQKVLPDQVAVPIENGYVMVHPMTDSDGSYPHLTQVTLGYYPNTAGTQGTWNGVDIVAGSIAEILMNRDREVTLTVMP